MPTTTSSPSNASQNSGRFFGGAFLPSAMRSPAARAVSQGFERRLGLVLTATVLCLVVGALVTFRNSARLRETTAEVHNTHEVLGALAAIRSLLEAAASATGAFAITGQEEYLLPYEWARSSLEGHLAELRVLTAGKPDQRRRLAEVAPMIETHMAYRALLVETARTQGIVAAQNLVRTHGRETKRQLVLRLEALESVERAKLVERRAESKARDRDALALSAALTLFVLAALGTFAVLVRHYLAERQRAEAEGSRFFDLSLDLLVIAQDGNFKRLSPALTPILGWTAAELEGRPFLDFVHPDDLATTEREIERQMVPGGVRSQLREPLSPPRRNLAHAFLEIRGR